MFMNTNSGYELEEYHMDDNLAMDGSEDHTADIRPGYGCTGSPVPTSNPT
jgi:hypothetical protein